MKLHYLQHVEFEGLANIEPWARSKGFDITGTGLHRMEKLPDPDSFDWLVVMGGPMNIYEEKEYPWLVSEKKFILDAIRKNKIVLGICLGAQLLADVLGGKVSRNRHKEIGWFPVKMLPGAQSSVPFRNFPGSFAAFHWHGDTFSIPPGAEMLAESEACPAQAFSFNGGRVLGLQFHLESSPESVGKLVQNCSDELVEGEYIQQPEKMLRDEKNFTAVHDSMNKMLENLRTSF